MNSGCVSSCNKRGRIGPVGATGLRGPPGMIGASGIAITPSETFEGVWSELWVDTYTRETSYFVINGICFMSFEFVSGERNVSAAIAEYSGIVPEGFRPLEYVHYPVFFIDGSSTTIMDLRIDTDGTISLERMSPLFGSNGELPSVTIMYQIAN